MINLIQPLPFYDRLTEQDRFKESCDGLYKFLCNNDKLIPFQIIVPLDSAVIDSIRIVGYSCIMELYLPDNNDQIYFQTTDDRKWLIYTGEQLTFTRSTGTTEPLLLKSDYYYFEVSIDGKFYYSEVFNVVGNGICDVPITLSIEAWHSKNMNGYSFDEGFRFKCFFNTFITNITADITDEYSKDGYERQILQRRVTIFTHNIELDPLPNSVAIGIAALTSFKNILIKHNGNEYNVKDITFKQEKIEGGCLDSILLAFTIFDQDIIRTNC